MNTHLVTLGTGTPIPEPDRSGPAFAVVVEDTSYLVDAGPGVVRRAVAAAERTGIAALMPPRLDRLFLTHLHSDHTAGLPDLLLMPWVVGRRGPLRVHGPKGTKMMLEKLSEAYAEDIAVRTGGLEGNAIEGVGWQCREIRAGPVYSDERVKVSAFRVRHGSWKHCFGFRFESESRTIVFSGDTAPFPGLAERIGPCDVLVHEVYASSGLAMRPEDRCGYHRAFHTATSELAEIATSVRPKLLVLTHQLRFGASEAMLLGEIQRLYSGAVVSARDLDLY